MNEHESQLHLRLREVEDNLGMLMAQRSMYQEKLGMAEWANVDDMYERVGVMLRRVLKISSLAETLPGACRQQIVRSHARRQRRPA